MFIEDFNFSGFRSYGSVLNNEPELKYRQINLFIGPNNSGKSNILNFFSTAQKIYNCMQQGERYAFSETDSYRNNTAEDLYGVIYLENDIQIHINKGLQNLMEFKNGNPAEFFNRLFFIDTERKNIDFTSDIKWIISNRLIKNYEEKLGKWLRKVLDEPVLVEINKNNNDVNLYFCTGTAKEWDLKQSLKNLGTGVIQALKILTALFKYINHFDLTGGNIFIEEPESNLHPKAVIALIDLLYSDELLSKNKYFITTHSNALIDRVDKNWTITSVFQRGNRTTDLVMSIKKKDTFEILNNLGVNPSQLLQSNLVIWVEGPSDRIYLKKWIELEADSRRISLTEGKDYSFIMYGGSLIDFCSVFVNEGHEEIKDTTDRFFDIISTSRYALVIADRDRGEMETKLKPRLEGLRKRIQENDPSNEFIKLITTHGREIENYVPESIFRKVLCDIEFHRHYFKYKDERIDFGPPSEKNLIPTFCFTIEDSFDVKFSELFIDNNIRKKYNLENNEETYNAIITNLSSTFDKVKVAGKVVKEYKYEEIDESLKLLINTIFTWINKSNNR
ncbi:MULTISPECIES: ATP-dependent nuclease [Bacillaceae]|uniref:ATP-dependent nuclease n=1 Tax=Bacillaceae TaxID=186817 RepID=UPI002964E5B8|nr:AAA family ATPase [Bacillus infantis]MDW2879556.1 AAA family ATPase [Bacillus infantis]